MNCSVRTRTLMAISKSAKNIGSRLRTRRIFHTKAQRTNQCTKKLSAFVSSFVPLCETISSSFNGRDDHVPTNPPPQMLKYLLGHERRQKSQLGARQLLHFNLHVFEHPKQRARLFAAVDFHKRPRAVIAELDHAAHDFFRRTSTQKLCAEQPASQHD